MIILEKETFNSRSTIKSKWELKKRVSRGYRIILISCGLKVNRLSVFQCHDHMSGCPNSYPNPPPHSLTYLGSHLAYSSLSIPQRTSALCGTDEISSPLI